MFFFRRYVYLFIILAIIAFGVFLRSYHFSDWMHFELDQARDANVISKAVDNGLGDLPLLGPKARGTFLRMGPIYYYFEYISAKIFGNAPPAMAYSVLFFSFFSLPLFYILLRRYFDKKISVGLLFLYSVSLFLVMYSRFAWNPNPLVFFVPLFIYSLLRAVDEQEKRKGLWLVSSFLALAIATQLHILAFIALPAVSLTFLLIKRPKIKLKYWLFSALAVLILYLPVVINESKTGGANAEEFAKAVSGRTEKQEASLAQKAFFNLKENSRNYFLILTSRDDSEIFKIDPRKIIGPSTNKLNLFDYSFGPVSFIFFLLGSVLFVVRLIKEKIRAKRDFLLLNGIWIAFVFLIFTPLALDLSPRFFLLLCLAPFIFLGLILEYFAGKLDRKFWLSSLVVIFIALLNILSVKERFGEMARAYSEPITIRTDKILKERARVTFFQENLIVDYMLSFKEKNGFPIFYDSDSYYQPAFEYILKRKNILFDEISKKNIYRNGNYFLISLVNQYRSSGIGDYEKPFLISGEKYFGTLVVVKLIPKEEAVTALDKNFNEPKKKARSRAPKRYLWKEIFGGELNKNDEEID